MRIVGGRFGGLRLAALGKGDAGAHLRPTADRVRESLFSALASRGAPIEKCAVLDLFAGTGALGLEALSRGAGHITFVENGRVALGLLHDNIERARAEPHTRVIRRDATRLPPRADDTLSVDLVFLDPPYGKALGARALAAARAGGWIAPGALIVWEENAPQEPPEGLMALETRRYGDTHVTLLRAGTD
jgi:16S rRNA (guanine966-N2)-methyltransferase